MAYVTGDADGLGLDTGLGGPGRRRRRRGRGKKGRKRRKRAIRAALRAGTSTAGMNQRLVAKLMRKRTGKAAITEARRKKQEDERARRERRRARIAAGTTKKQLRKAAEQAEKQAERRQEKVALEVRRETAEAFVPTFPPPPPDRRRGWQWTGAEWVFARPELVQDTLFDPPPPPPPRPIRFTELPPPDFLRPPDRGETYAPDFGFDTRLPDEVGQAPTAAGGLPQWAIPAAIAAAAFLL